MVKQEQPKKQISKTEAPKTYFRGKGRMIGALIPQLTRPVFRKKSPLFMRLVLDWENLLGPALARESEPCRLRPGVLTVRCCGPAAVELQYASPRILAQINMACGLYGEEALTQLKLVQDKPVYREAAAPVLRQQSVAPVSIEGIEDGPLREVLERLGGHVAARKRGAKKRRSF